MAFTISGTGGLTFPDATTMTTGSQACKAWVNFNGTGTVAIRGAYNVSSITDLGTGSYRVNFTTAMPDINYSMATGPVGIGSNVGSLQLDTYATTYVTVVTRYADLNAYDWNTVSISIFR